MATVRSLALTSWVGIALGVVAAAAPSAGRVPEVVGAAGSPVEGAKVTVLVPVSEDASLLARRQSRFRTTTDPFGGPVAELPWKSGAVLVVDDGEHAPALLRGLERIPRRIRLEPGREIVLELRPGEGELPELDSRSIHVQAKWEEPVPEAATSIEYRRQWAELLEGGKVRLAGLGTVPVRVELFVPGFRPWSGRIEPGRTVSVSLEAAVAVAGAVLEAGTGGPLVGASVHLMGSRVPLAISDRLGKFSAAVPGVEAVLRFEAEGHGSRELALREIEPSKWRQLSTALEPLFELRGELLDRCGIEEAISIQAVVESASADGPGFSRSYSAQADPQGRFRLFADLEGNVRVRLRSEVHEDSPPQEVKARRGTSWDLGAVALPCAGRVKGRVVAAELGQPVAGALVRLLPMGPALAEVLRRPRSLVGSSDLEGSFQVAGVPPGRYLLLAEGSGALAGTREVELVRGERIELGEIRLAPRAVLEGRFLRRDGTAWANAAVRVLDPEGHLLDAVATATTDPAGRFRLELPRGQYLVRAEVGRIGVAVPVELAGEREEVRLESREVRLAGTVLWQGELLEGGTVRWFEGSGRPLERPKLVLRDASSGSAGRPSVYGLEAPPVEAQLEREGRFQLTLPESGAGLLEVLHPDGRTARLPLEVPDSPVAELSWNLEPRAVEGWLREGPGGEPLAGKVAVLTEKGQVLGEGSADEETGFRLWLEGDARGELVAWVDGRACQRRSLAAETGMPLVLDCPLRRASALEASLLSESGEEAAWVSYALLASDGRILRSGFSSPAGKVLLGELPPDRYRLLWWDPVAGVGLEDSISLESGQDRKLTLELPRGTELLLHCPPGGCREGEAVSWSLASETGQELAPLFDVPSRGLHLPASGAIRLGRLAPGKRYRLRVEGRGWQESREFEAAGTEEVFQLP